MEERFALRAALARIRELERRIAELEAERRALLEGSTLTHPDGLLPDHDEDPETVEITFVAEETDAGVLLDDP